MEFLSSLYFLVESILANLSSNFYLGTLYLLTLGGLVSVFNMAHLYSHCALSFGRDSEPHKDDPEVLNFRLATGPYHRPTYQTRKLVTTTFGENVIRLGNVTARQAIEIFNDDFVGITLESDDRLSLSLCIPGDPHLPLDLRKAVNHVFEVRPSFFVITDYQSLELIFIRNHRGSFSLEAIPKDRRDCYAVLHYRDLSKPAPQVSQAS